MQVLWQRCGRKSELLSDHAASPCPRPECTTHTQGCGRQICKAAALGKAYPYEFPKQLCVWPVGWSDGVIQKPWRICIEAEKQGDFYSGQNTNPFQVSMSGQPARHGEHLREKLGLHSNRRRGNTDSP